MSYQTLTDGYLTKEQCDKHAVEWGRYNDPLPNMKEITAEEFAQSGFFTWSITGVEFRQIDPTRFAEGNLLIPTKSYISVKIFYCNGPGESGFAMSADYWEKRVRYFKFAKCYHEWEEIPGSSIGGPAFNHYHYCKCKKCGANWEYDSSG